MSENSKVKKIYDEKGNLIRIEVEISAVLKGVGGIK